MHATTQTASTGQHHGRATINLTDTTDDRPHPHRRRGHPYQRHQR